jgi:CubicO group peptidase (beta-lactamase class C family)
VGDTLAKFFPDAPPDKKGITLHQLLTHTSGLESDFAGDYEPVGRDEYVRRILGSKLRTQPGTEYFYANSGYSLLAAIVEMVSGLPYESYLQQQLFGPAGMKETGYRVPRWEPRRVPVGYREGERWGTMLERPWAEDGPWWALRGNGGIQSTLADLKAWSVALDGDRVLSAAAREKLFWPHVKEGAQADSHYGYGWTIFTTPWNTKLAAHNGGNGIFSADLARYLDDRLLVVVSASDSRVKAWRFSPDLARIARGEEVAPAKLSAGGATTAAPLGDAPRHGVIRSFVEAHNTHDIERMRAFRAAHMARGPQAPSEEQRDQMARRMWDDFGTLAVDGVLGQDEESVTVRMRPASAPPVRFTFYFTPETKIAGVKIEAGD